MGVDPSADVGALTKPRFVFAVSGGLLAVALLVELVTFSRVVEHPAVEDVELEILPGTLRALRSDSRLLVLVLGGGLLAIGFTWWQTDGLVVIREQATLGSTAYAALFAIAAAIVVAGQLPLNRLLRDVAAPRVPLGGAIVQAASVSPCSLPPAPGTPSLSSRRH